MVVIKEVEGLDVMDRETAPVDAAMLAGVVVALTSGGALRVPVSSSVLLAAPTPCGIVRARPFGGSTPDAEAPTVAEVVLFHGILRLVKRLAACVASDCWHTLIIRYVWNIVK